MQYSEDRLKEIVKHSSHGQAEFDSVVDGKVLTRTANGFRFMSMGQVKQSEVRMNLTVEREFSQDLSAQAKQNVIDERVAKAEANKARIETMSADAQAKRNLHNADTSFSGQGQSVAEGKY